jgi:hypothetical protein
MDPGEGLEPPPLPHYPWKIWCLRCDADADEMRAYTIPAVGNLLVRAQDHLTRSHGLVRLDLENSARREVDGSYVWSIRDQDYLKAWPREEAQ